MMDPNYFVVGGAAMVVGAFFKGLYNLYQERNRATADSKKDAMTELWKINESQQRQLENQAKIIAGHTEDIRLVQAREQECIRQNHVLEIKIVEMSAELRNLHDIVLRLQKKTGDDYLSTVPGLIIADMDGMIRKYSPSLMPLLGYDPSEVEGENLLMLVPSDLKDKYSVALLKAKEGKEVATSPILTYGLTKDGHTIPIMINLEKFNVGDDGNKKCWLSATIRRRAQKPVLEPE